MIVVGLLVSLLPFKLRDSKATLLEKSVMGPKIHSLVRCLVIVIDLPVSLLSNKTKSFRATHLEKSGTVPASEIVETSGTMAALKIEYRQGSELGEVRNCTVSTFRGKNDASNTSTRDIYPLYSECLELLICHCRFQLLPCFVVLQSSRAVPQLLEYRNAWVW